MRIAKRRLQNTSESSEIKLYQEILSLFELSAIDGKSQLVRCSLMMPGTNVGLRGESEKRCKPGPKCGRCKPGRGGKTMS